MENLTIDLQSIERWVSNKELANYIPSAGEALNHLHNKTGKGNDFLGWVNLPEEASRQTAEILEKTRKFSKGLNCVVVIGIGGSYLGTKAVIDALKHPFQTGDAAPEICYAGHHLSEDYLVDLIEYLGGKNWGIVVISKSGTTTEPAIAFRLLNDALSEQFGTAETRQRIIAITDSKKGALRTLADQQGYETFVIPDDVGGRYSVLTPVGLVPIAIAGLDINKMIQGANDMARATRPEAPLSENPAVLYAAARNALLEKGKTTEILANFNPKLHYISEWWKQLFGESEGKDNKGIFPASVDLTTDLHSMGQYIQDGPRNLFETFITVKTSEKELRVPGNDEDLDQLNYIAGRRIEDINQQAALGTLLAHVDGGVPVIQIRLNKLNEYHLGALFYFFEISCGISGYMLGVNPFDQPGVEDYKRNMFALLGKNGFEAQTTELRKRLEK